ncbi:MAG TPA: phage antirepressor N-terminal domain-containing protein [Ktedonobacterales bacterium]|jgi:hypothetical protein
MGTQKNQAVMIPVEQDSITFHEHELIAVRLEDGRIAAVLRWLCDSLRLDPQGQLQRIHRKTALAEGLVSVRVDTTGGPQEMPALTLDVLPGYLFTIDENRVKPEARADVVLFQRECVKVLADHFTRKHPPAIPSATDATAASVIIEQITDLTAVINLLREHLEMLLGLPSQVADLSAQVGETHALVESLATRQDATETHLAAVDARTQRLTPAHARAVQEMVNRMVRETRHSATPFTYATIYGKLKTRFQAGSYNQIADSRFDELMTWLRETLSNATGGEAPEQGSLF